MAKQRKRRGRSGQVPKHRGQPTRVEQRLGLTLEQLEGVVWPEPQEDSYLISTTHRLRKKPIGTFTVEDLRIMIGQAIGLFYLIPRAIELLEREPLAEGDYYPGDLLSSVTGVAPSFYERHADWAARVGIVSTKALIELEGMSRDDWSAAEEDLAESIRQFCAKFGGEAG